MGGDVQLLNIEKAYERTPGIGWNGLQLSLARYLPPANRVDIDDEIKLHAEFKDMYRILGRKLLVSGVEKKKVNIPEPKQCQLQF